MKRRETNVFSIAFLDLLSGALGAVIILFVSVPKAKNIKPNDKIINHVKKLSGTQKSASSISPEDVKKLKKSNKELKSISENLKIEKENLEMKVASLEKMVNALKKQGRDREVASIPADVGFKFKGKNIVLVIDVSGSMFLEDKIGQVKAGLKMLVTSMGKDFSIDVVHFPDGMTRDYRTLWGQIKTMNQSNKKSVYNFLQDLKPWGGTPTREVMTYVLNRYHNATDIVLLSDGAPTIKNSKRKDDVEAVADHIKSENRKDVQISTIGVGSDFFKDETNPKYRFLKKVAEDNKGFFVGF